MFTPFREKNSDKNLCIAHKTHIHSSQGGMMRKRVNVTFTFS
jgi:hypothetical protein